MTDSDREDTSQWQDVPDGGEVRQRPDGEQEWDELAEPQEEEGIIPTPTPPQGRESH